MNTTIMDGDKGDTGLNRWEYWGQTESLGSRYAWAAGRLTNVSWQAGGSNMSASYAYKPGSDLLAETAFNSAAGLALKRAYDAQWRRVRKADLSNRTGSMLSAEL